MLERAKSRNNGCSCSQAAKPQMARGRFNDYPRKGHKCVNRSTAQMYGVGETPLNGKGMALTGNAEGQEIVYPHAKV